jgi:hypothetical protein
VSRSDPTKASSAAWAANGATVVASGGFTAEPQTFNPSPGKQMLLRQTLFSELSFDRSSKALELGDVFVVERQLNPLRDHQISDLT